MKDVKFYQCNGWQNVGDYSRQRIKFPISVSYYSAENAHSVMTFTHARNKSLRALLAELKESACVSRLGYTVTEQAN